MAIYTQNNTSPNHDEIRGLSLCAGVGGLDLGIHIAEPNYRTVCYVERESFAASTLVARMEDESLHQAPIWDDLKSFNGKAWRGKVHIISAGYPCQPFSYAGNRKGENDPRHLWPDVRRIVDEARPGIVFFENVAGHIDLGLRDVTSDLQDMGFRVAARVVSASEVGASHQRERIFIMGHANDKERRQSSGRSIIPKRHSVQKQPQSDGIANRADQSSPIVDTALADHGRNGLEGQSLPSFPPKPSDLAQWRETFKRFPHLKPCIHRLDDGLAHWVERSASAGNGVVSLAAANAWVALREVLNNA